MTKTDTGGRSQPFQVGDVVYKYGQPQSLYVVKDVYLVETPTPWDGKPDYWSHWGLDVWSKKHGLQKQLRCSDFKSLDDLIEDHKRKLNNHIKRRDDFLIEERKLQRT